MDLLFAAILRSIPLSRISLSSVSPSKLSLAIGQHVSSVKSSPLEVLVQNTLPTESAGLANFSTFAEEHLEHTVAHRL